MQTYHAGTGVHLENQFNSGFWQGQTSSYVPADGNILRGEGRLRVKVNSSKLSPLAKKTQSKAFIFLKDCQPNIECAKWMG